MDLAAKFNMEGTLEVAESYCIVNCTPHGVKFYDDSQGETYEVPPSGFGLKADVKSSELWGLSWTPANVVIMRQSYVPSSEGDNEIEWLRQNKDRISDLPLLIVGSIVSAEAWPHDVVSLVVVEGQERMHPAMRAYYADRFNTFYGR